MAGGGVTPPEDDEEDEEDDEEEELELPLPPPPPPQAASARDVNMQNVRKTEGVVMGPSVPQAGEASNVETMCL